MNITFSIDSYDKDGDIMEPGIFLHFEDRFSLRLKDFSALERMINNLIDIRDEILWFQEIPTLTTKENH